MFFDFDFFAFTFIYWFFSSHFFWFRSCRTKPTGNADHHGPGSRGHPLQSGQIQAGPSGQAGLRARMHRRRVGNGPAQIHRDYHRGRDGRPAKEWSGGGNSLQLDHEISSIPFALYDVKKLVKKTEHFFIIFSLTRCPYTKRKSKDANGTCWWWKALRSVFGIDVGR